MSTQFYAPDQQATSPQEADRTERWNTTARPITPKASRTRIGVGVDARKLWAGGAASAVVAGLVAMVGVLVSRWLFTVPVLAPRQEGAYGDVRTTALILAATTIIVVFPFSTSAPLDAKIATAVVNLAVGIAAGTLVGGIAARSAVPYGGVSRH
jgi:hypothetical protein